MHDSTQLRLWIFGFQISQAIHVAARLGLADFIDEAPQSVQALAERTGCNADGLLRLLRALAGLELFSETAEGFIHTPRSRLLRRDHPQSQYLAAAVYGAEHYTAWGDLYQAVKSGEPIFEQRFGQGYYPYLEGLAQTSALQHQYQTHDENARNQAIDSIHDAATLGLRVDVDGPQSALLPNADTYVLSHRLHRFDDGPAVALLAHCRAAMHANSRVLVIELMLREQPGFDAGHWLDLNSLLLCGGRERTQTAYLELAKLAGLKLAASYPLNTGMTMLDLRLA